MNARLDAWLGPLKLRVLLPLVAITLYATTSLSMLLAMALGVASHYEWRYVVFSTVVVTLGTVTGIKTRQH